MDNVAFILGLAWLMNRPGICAEGGQRPPCSKINAKSAPALPGFSRSVNACTVTTMVAPYGRVVALDRLLLMRRHVTPIFSARVWTHDGTVAFPR
jgi:hypothetical protein